MPYPDVSSPRVSPCHPRPSACPGLQSGILPTCCCGEQCPPREVGISPGPLGRWCLPSCPEVSSRGRAAGEGLAWGQRRGFPGFTLHAHSFGTSQAGLSVPPLINTCNTGLPPHFKDKEREIREAWLTEWEVIWRVVASLSPLPDWILSLLKATSTAESWLGHPGLSWCTVPSLGMFAESKRPTVMQEPTPCWPSLCHNHCQEGHFWVTGQLDFWVAAKVCQPDLPGRLDLSSPRGEVNSGPLLPVAHWHLGTWLYGTGKVGVGVRKS